MNPEIRSDAHEARRYEPWPQPKARRLPSCMPASWPCRRERDRSARRSGCRCATWRRMSGDDAHGIDKF